ncbi:MAG: transposase [Clostridia bacterium]
MFRANDSHKQQPIFSSLDWMHEKARERFKKSWAPVFYEHVFCHINEEPFAKLYSKTGRPNTPVNILLSLEYIKYMKDLNDQDLLDSLYLDYQTTYAVGGKTLGEIYISERTLYYFRERVYEYLTEHPEDENLLFGQFIELLRNFAKLTGTSLDEQRTDTTMFVSNIKKAGRLALAYDVLEKGVKAIPKEQRPESMGKVLEKDFKTEMLHKVRTVDTESRLTTLLSMSAEALKILKELPDKKESDEVRILERFIKEQSETDENGNLVPKKSKEISSDSLQSAYDEDATYRKKGNKGQSGYVLEVSETCSKDNKVQLITDYAVKPNVVSDKEILSGRIRKVKENTGCTDMYIDGGFHSEDVYKAAEANDVPNSFDGHVRTEAVGQDLGE